MNGKRSKLALLLAAAVLSGRAWAQVISINGGFETGDFSGWTQFPTGVGQQTIVTDNPSEGTFAARILNNTSFSNSLMKQANVGVGVVQPNGQQLTVSFDARGSFPIGGVAFAEFFSELSGGGTSKAEILGNAPLAVNPDPNIWTSFSFVVTTGVNVSGGVTLQLGAVNGADAGTEMFFDNVSISIGVVDPTPGSKWVSNLSGDYFNPVNWQSGIIPNGVDAIANFTTPIASGTRTVFADSGYTLGTLRFDSANTYQLVGTDMTISSTTGGLIEVLEGTPKINLETTFATDTEISVADGASLRISDPVTLAAGVTLTKTGDGALIFQSSVTSVSAATLVVNSGGVNFDGTDVSLGEISGAGEIAVNHGSLSIGKLTAASLAIADGASATLEAGSAAPAVLGVLSIGGSGSFSTEDNDLVVDYTGTSPLADLASYISAGQLVAFGDVDGISTLLVLFEAADIGLTEFGGVVVDESTVIGKFTYTGDANLDGQVDAFDYGTVDSNFGNPGSFITGDLNQDGFVDAFDYANIDDTFGAGIGSPLKPAANTEVFIPEPSSLGMLAVAGGLLARRRRA